MASRSKKEKSKEYDIRKLGPLSYRKLQEQNAILASLSTLEAPEPTIIPRSAFQYEGYEQSPLMQQGNGDYWGNSIYDEDSTTTDEWEDLNEVRAENQPWYAKLGAGVAKGLGNAATSFLSGTVGIAYGIGSAVNGGSFWDNDFNKAMDDVNLAMEEALPNYYTRDEIENPLAWRNIFSANTLGDKLIKTLGFGVGMFYSGGIVTGALKATRLPMLLTKLTGSAKAARAITSLVASTTTAAGEASMEAYRGAAELVKAQTAMVEMDYEDLVNSLMRAYAPAIQANDLQAIAELNNALETLDANKEATLAKIKENGRKAGDDIWLGNMAVLMPSNLILFGKVFARGFSSMRNSLEVAGSLGNYTKNISKAKLAINLAKGAISEGMEEVSQGAISRGTANYYEKDLNNFTAALEDPDAKLETLNMMSEITGALVESFATDEGKEEFLLGAVTGALGIPTIGRRKSGKIGPKLEGGIFSEIADYRRLKAGEEFMATQLNNRANDPAFKSYYEGLVRHNKYEDNKKKAIINNDEKSFEDSDNALLVSDIIMFDSVGKLGDLEAVVKHLSENLTDEELDAVIKTTSLIDEETGEVLGGTFVNTNREGISTPMNATEEGRQQMREIIKSNAKKVLDTISVYKKSATEIEVKTEGKLSDKQLQELVFMDVQNKHWKLKLKDSLKALDDIKLSNPELLDEGSALSSILEKSQVNIFSRLVSTKKKVKALQQVAKNNPELITRLKEEIDNITEIDNPNYVLDIIDALDKIEAYDKKYEEYLKEPEKLTLDQTKLEKKAKTKEVQKKKKQAELNLLDATIGDIVNDSELLADLEAIEAAELNKEVINNPVFNDDDFLYYEDDSSNNIKKKAEEARKVQKILGEFNSMMLQARDAGMDPVVINTVERMFSNAIANTVESAEEVLDRKIVSYNDSLSLIDVLNEDPEFLNYTEELKNAVFAELNIGVLEALDSVISTLNSRYNKWKNTPSQQGSAGNTPAENNQQDDSDPSDDHPAKGDPINKDLNLPKGNLMNLPSGENNNIIQAPVVLPAQEGNQHPTELNNSGWIGLKPSTPRLPIKSILGDMTPWYRILYHIKEAKDKKSKEQELSPVEKKYYDFYQEDIENPDSAMNKFNMLTDEYIKRAGIIHSYLLDKGAFDAVDSGLVLPNDIITFVVDSDLSSHVGHTVVLLAKIGSNDDITIVGDFLRNAANAAIIKAIEKDYNDWRLEDNEGIYISKYTTKVKQNYVGRIPYSAKEDSYKLNHVFPVKAGKSSIIFGIVSDSRGTISVDNTEIKSTEVRPLKNSKPGQPVILIKTSDQSKSSNRKYVSVPFIMKPYSEDNSNTALGKMVQEAIEELEEALKEELVSDSLIVAFKEALIKPLSLELKDVWTQVTSSEVILKIKKRGEEKATTIKIPRDANIVENLKSELYKLNIPFQINKKAINELTEDNEDYNEIIGEVAEVNLLPGSTHTLSDFFTMESPILEGNNKPKDKLIPKVESEQQDNIVNITAKDGSLYNVNTDTWEVTDSSTNLIVKDSESTTPILNIYRAIAWGNKTGLVTGSTYDTDWGLFDSQLNLFIPNIKGYAQIKKAYKQYEEAINIPETSSNQDSRAIQIYNASYNLMNAIEASEIEEKEGDILLNKIYEETQKLFDSGYYVANRKNEITSDPNYLFGKVSFILDEYVKAGDMVVHHVIKPSVVKEGKVLQEGEIIVRKSTYPDIESWYLNHPELYMYTLVVVFNSVLGDSYTNEHDTYLCNIQVGTELYTVCISVPVKSDEVAEKLKSSVLNKINLEKETNITENRIKELARLALLEYLESLKEGNNLPVNTDVANKKEQLTKSLKRNKDLIPVLNSLTDELVSKLPKSATKAKGVLQLLQSCFDAVTNTFSDPQQVESILSNDKYRKKETIEKPSKEKQVKKEARWFKRILPNLSAQDCLTIVENMLDIKNSNMKAWGKFTNGTIQVFKNATRGTVYHEAFHAVFNMLMSKQELEQMLKEAARIYPELKNNEVALEEALAEDFRRYTLRMNIPFIGSVVKGFRKLRMLCRRLSRKLHYLNNIYFRINNGDYGKRNIISDAQNITRNNAQLRLKQLNRELAQAKEEIPKVLNKWELVKAEYANKKSSIYRISRIKYLTLGAAYANVPPLYLDVLEVYEDRGRYVILPKTKYDISLYAGLIDSIIKDLEKQIYISASTMELQISDEALLEQEDKYRVAKLTGTRELINADLISDVKAFLRNFNISLQDVNEYQDKEPMFDSLNRIIYYKSNKDITESVGYAIAFMMLHDPVVNKIFWKKSPIYRILFKAAGLLKNPKSARAYLYRKLPSRNMVLKGLGHNIAKELLAVYGGRGFIDSVEETPTIINNFFKNWTINSKSLYNLITKYSRNAVNSIRLNDPTSIVSSTKKPGTNDETSRVFLKDALIENPYEESIIYRLGLMGYALAGSAALSVTGTVFRPSENPLHDIDFLALGKTKEQIQETVNLISPNNTFIRTIKNDSGPTYTYLIIDRPFEIIRPVKGTAVYVILDPKTGDKLGTYTGSELTLSKGVQGKFLDFFTGKKKYENHKVLINNKEYLIGNENYAMEAKVDWQRNKDIWDYYRFLPEELYLELEAELQLQDLKLLNRIQKADIIWGHPAMGKTTYLESHEDIIEWDKEVNPKRNKFILQLIDPNNELDENTYNKLKLEYMANSQSHPEYLEFLAREWEALKQKAKRQNKKIFASPLPLLRMFPLDFDLVINLNHRLFMKNNMGRGGKLFSSIDWKYAINEVLTTIPKDRIFTTGKYLSEIAPEGVSYINSIQLYHLYKNTYNNLDQNSKEYLREKGISQLEFDSWSQEEREIALHCKA